MKLCAQKDCFNAKSKKKIENFMQRGCTRVLLLLSGPNGKRKRVQLMEISSFF